MKSEFSFQSLGTRQCIIYIAEKFSFIIKSLTNSNIQMKEVLATKTQDRLKINLVFCLDLRHWSHWQQTVFRVLHKYTNRKFFFLYKLLFPTKKKIIFHLFIPVQNGSKFQHIRISCWRDLLSFPLILEPFLEQCLKYDLSDLPPFCLHHLFFCPATWI